MTDNAQASPPADATDFGSLLIVVAPSGAGKTSLVRHLLAERDGVRLSVSFTTRAPRPGEQNGVDYHFVCESEFIARRDAGEFLEWALVHGNYYGTSKSWIAGQMAEGVDIVLEIDWQGAVQIKRLFPGAVLIFILPPSWDELLQRLERRGEDGPDVIATRMANARLEVAQARHFDFVVINAVFDTAVFDLKAIVHAQRLKYSRQRRSKAAVFQALDLD